MLTITLDKSFWKTNANNDNKRKKVGLGKEHATISFLYKWFLITWTLDNSAISGNLSSNSEIGGVRSKFPALCSLWNKLEKSARKFGL